MMNVIINNITKTVEGVNTTPSPMSSVIKVQDNFNLIKLADIEEGFEQKNNEEGQPLFYNRVNKIVEAEIVTGQDETTIVTDTPAMITVQKTNESGEKIYLEPIKDIGGNIIEYIEVTNATNKYGTENSPVMIVVQKMAKGAKPVYLINVVEKVKVEVLDYIEETTTETLSPIMLPIINSKFVSIFEHPEKFNADEVIELRHSTILSQHNKKEAWASLFLDSSELNTLHPDYSANSGVGFVLLPPNNGTAVIKEIKLEEKVTELEILELEANDYVTLNVNGIDFTDGKVVLSKETDTLEFKLINTNDKSVEVSSVIVGY